jgi:ADP-heptose:LPS heptosyltransferase
MAALQIYDRRERALVAAGDAVLSAIRAAARPFRRRTPPAVPRRILLLRLERIGDLLMALPAIADVRAAAPDAEIDLAVGSWNAELAANLSGISRVITLDPSWLARGSAGLSLAAVLRAARHWRRSRYDLALNFEPDVRTNMVLAVSGAKWTAGYNTGGGGPLLDQSLEYRPSEHTTDNARRLVATVLRTVPADTSARILEIPVASQREADTLLVGARRPVVAMHVAGGRAVKQWDPDNFGQVARSLVERQGGTIVLTGSRDDAALVNRVKALLPFDRVVDASPASGLLTVAAVLQRCELMITGDTGPMHLASAVGTPIVAVFGPSDPARYAPRGPRDRIVRIDLPCAPCNRIRLPPARCTGTTPDCLALVTPEMVLAAAVSVLAGSRDDVRNIPA